MLKIYNYSVFEIGILFSIAPLIRFISPFLFVKILNLNFHAIKISMLLHLISVILFFYSLNNFYYLLVVVFIYGVSFNQFLPYIEIIAIKHISKDNYGSMRLFGSLGFIAVALVVPYFMNSELTPLYVVVICSLVMYASIIAIYLDTKEDTHKQHIKEDKKFSLLSVWPFWVAIFLMQVSFGGMYNFFTIYSLEHNLSIKIISYLWTFGVICEIIMFYYQKHILNKFSFINMMKFSVLSACVRWMIVFLYPSSSLALFISQSLHAFSFALFHSICIFYLSKTYKNQELAQLFYLGISFGIGGFIGASLAGIIYGQWLFLFESIIALIALFFVFNLDKKRF